MTKRPDPAIRHRPPKMTVDGSGSFRELSVTSITSREKLCQECWNVRTKTEIYIRRDWFARGALVVVACAAVLCAWMAFDAHVARRAAEAHAKFLEK